MRRLPLLLASAALLVLPACSSNSSTDTTATTDVTATAGSAVTADSAVAADSAAPVAVPCPAADGSSPKTQKFDVAPTVCIDVAKKYVATMVTNKGTMIFALDPTKAPITVNSFVFLARYHYFDGIGFHRVVPSFVLQGGDPLGTGLGGPGYNFADELPKAGEYKFGSLAMANSGPNTNGSQFFIISGPQGEQLPPSYSLFGQLTSGDDVVKAIDALGVGDGAPKEPVTITSVTIEAR